MAGMALTLALSGCASDGSVDPGKVQTTTQSVELGQATSVKAVVSASTVTDVTLRDGADPLLDAQFTFNQLLKPNLSYSADNGLGNLEISQPDRQNLDSGKLKNEWDLRFGSSAPVDLATDITSGNTRIDVSSLQLSSLTCHTSSGNLNASIRGTQEQLNSIDLTSTSGSVQVEVNGTFSSLSNLTLHNSSGNMDLATSGGFHQLANLQIENTSGNVTVDLGGSFDHDLRSSIRTASGNVTVHLPTGVGLRVTASVSSGHITANGLHLDGNAYVNDTFGSSAVTLQFDVHVTSGNIVLSVGG